MPLHPEFHPIVSADWVRILEMVVWVENMLEGRHIVEEGRRSQAGVEEHHTFLAAVELVNHMEVDHKTAEAARRNLAVEEERRSLVEVDIRLVAVEGILFRGHQLKLGPVSSSLYSRPCGGAPYCCGGAP